MVFALSTPRQARTASPNSHPRYFERITTDKSLASKNHLYSRPTRPRKLGRPRQLHISQPPSAEPRVSRRWWRFFQEEYAAPRPAKQLPPPTNDPPSVVVRKTAGNSPVGRPLSEGPTGLVCLTCLMGVLEVFVPPAPCARSTVQHAAAHKKRKYHWFRVSVGPKKIVHAVPRLHLPVSSARGGIRTLPDCETPGVDLGWLMPADSLLPLPPSLLPNHARDARQTGSAV